MRLKVRWKRSFKSTTKALFYGHKAFSPFRNAAQLFCWVFAEFFSSVLLHFTNLRHRMGLDKAAYFMFLPLILVFFIKYLFLLKMIFYFYGSAFRATTKKNPLIALSSVRSCHRHADFLSEYRSIFADNFHFFAWKCRLWFLGTDKKLLLHLLLIFFSFILSLFYCQCFYF